MDMDREMFKHHTKVNKGESILRWHSTYSISDKTKYATSPENVVHFVLVHEYYSHFDHNIVFVTVDMTLRSTHLDIRAYVRLKIHLSMKTEGVIFTPAPCDVVYSEPKREANTSCKGVTSVIVCKLLSLR